MCKVSKLHSGTELVQSDLISLNTNYDNCKGTRVKTNRYTDNYSTRDNNKKSNREDTNKIIRRNCKKIYLVVVKKKEFIEVLDKDYNRREKM